MKKIVLSALLLATTVAFAQESKFSVSGSVDTYYSTNLSTDALGTTGILSDVDANGFGLGMANTVFTYEKGKGGVVADLAFGPRANAANAYTGAINQLYAYYQATDKLKFTLGQFNTFFGYEVISPSGNFNYSVSYLFKTKGIIVLEDFDEEKLFHDAIELNVIDIKFEEGFAIMEINKNKDVFIKNKLFEELRLKKDFNRQEWIPIQDEILEFNDEEPML